MPNLLRMTGCVLGCFLAFALVGAALMFFDIYSLLRGLWECVGLWEWGEWEGLFFFYGIWFVVGGCCALSIYSLTSDNPDSPVGRRTGLQLLVITSVVAVVLGELSSFVWSSDSGALVPENRGLTITYLVTVVLVVALARFVVFGGPVRARLDSAKPPPEKKEHEPLSQADIAASNKKWELKHRRKALRKSKCVQPDVERSSVAVGPEQDRKDPGAFKPAGVWETVGFLIGVPVLLFLDASFFLFGPFDYFDRWTDPILSTSLGGGLAWGFASARWRSPRVWLLVVHAPLLIGAVFGFVALLLGGLLVAFDVPEQVSEIVSYVGFGIGFLLGCVAVVARFAEIFDRAVSGSVVRR